MLARKLMGRIRGRVADEPEFEVGPLTHLNPFYSQTTTGTFRAYRFNAVPQAGAPTPVDIPGGVLDPLQQLPWASKHRGTITLIGNDVAAEDLQPRFGSTGRSAVVFRANAQGMAADALEVLPYVPSYASSPNEWTVVWHEHAIRDLDSSAITLSHAAMNLRTGATNMLSTPNSSPMSDWINLGHAALLLPGQNIGGASGTFVEFGAGMARTRYFAAPYLGPTAYGLRVTAQPARNCQQFAYIAAASDAVSEHEIPIDVEMDPIADAELVHRVKDFRLLGLWDRFQTVRDGTIRHAVEVRIWEVWRSPLGAPVVRSEGSNQHTLYPCTMTQRIVGLVGLMTIGPSGEVTFVPWSDRRQIKATSAMHYRGEVTGSGASPDPTAHWYYRANSGSTNIGGDWPSVSPFSPTEQPIDLPSAPAVPTIFCLSDRFAMAGSGVWRFWAYDGTWIGDAAYPAGVASNAGPSVISGDDVLMVGGYYSRDMGQTWTLAPTPTARADRLLPVRLF